MSDISADTFGYDLEELRRRALNHEIRRRRVDAPSRALARRSTFGVGNAALDPKRRSVLLAEIRKSRQTIEEWAPDIRSRNADREQALDFNESTSSLFSNSSKSRKDRLGGHTLQTINVQKQSIAELRPTRRKIKWNSAISDWERKSDVEMLQPKHQLSSLHLGDLQIHGIRSLPSEKSEGTNEKEFEEAKERDTIMDVTENPELHTDELEDCIRRRFRELRSVQAQAASTRQDLSEVEKANDTLRTQLESMNTQQRRMAAQPLSPSHVASHVDKLRAKLAKLDAELGELKMQKKAIDADCLILKEILDVKSVDHRDLDEQFSAAEESEIKSFLTGDFTSEDMGLFSLPRSGIQP